MSWQRIASLALMAVGFGLLVAGVWGLLSSSDDESVSSTLEAVEEVSATTTVLPTTSPTSTTTTLAATTTASTTTTSTTTTTVAVSTTSLPPTQQVEAFVAEFAAALAGGDGEFVFSRLHPALVLGFGEELCRQWIGAEIMGLSNYALSGSITGPITGSLDTPTGAVVFDERYSAPVSFTFSGAEFSTDADFVLLDGEVYFTGTCR